MKRLLFIILIAFAFSISHAQVITGISQPGDVPLINESMVVSIVTDPTDALVVKTAANLLAADLFQVTGRKPVRLQALPTTGTVIIAGTIQSPLINSLVKSKKINIDRIKNKWEAFQIQLIKKYNGKDHALVVAGSDRRGTAFGILELSKQAGVSPWYWWADVPVQKKKEIHATTKLLIDSPLVKYRGIFINDEAPALSGWTREKFGGFNHKFYRHVFELMLRLKANYIWPAMWGNAFYDDDPLNRETADQYGIVIGTSHHEPLMRAHDEWRRHGRGKWNYDSNAVNLRNFWKEGVARASNEKIISIGMRGDGDEPMTRETATELLQRIVQDQRVIIEEVTGRPARETPQLWALYKEVQDYYDKGMRVPDDVTLLLCDDNWGNIRKLPRLNETRRQGGYGIYYHFDYVGGPRNYKWVNTNPIPRIWEQMHLAWEYKARQLWIVNVGDIKPMEFPISFFLDYAWNPTRISATDLQKYTETWAANQFPPEFAKEIAAIISAYTKYNGRRKPELLNANSYHLYNYNEYPRVTNDYVQLRKRAEKIHALLPEEFRDAYFQLVLHPVKACSNLYEMYLAVARNQDAASRNDTLANQYAREAIEFYGKDSLITLEYHQRRNGKWNHMMSQAHIGYTNWQQPARQKIPDLKYVSNDSAVFMKKEPAIWLWAEGFISLDAAGFTRAVNTDGISWQVLPDHGRTGDAITAYPVTASPKVPGSGSPHLQYEIFLGETGAYTLQTYFSPTLDFHNNGGLRFAVSIDDEKPRIVNLNAETNDPRHWNRWVAANIIIKTTSHTISTRGKHTIKFWMVDPGVVLQKLVLEIGEKLSCYLGPPEQNSKRNK